MNRRFVTALATALMAGHCLIASAGEPKKLALQIAREGKSSRVALDASATAKDAFERAHLDPSADAPLASKLRTAWKEVRRSGGTETVTIHGDRPTTVQEKKGAAIVRVEGDGEPLVVTIPSTAMDAFLSKTDDEVDYDAALRALWARGEHEPISIARGTDTVALRLE
jgi:hypothetical protein